MKIELSNRQSQLKIDPAKLEALSNWLLQRAAEHNPARKWSGFSLVLVDHSGMIEINKISFEKDTTTDVISFAYPPMPHEDGWTGEVIVNTELACEEGTARGDVSREFAFYLAHGIDHLSGSDDATDEQRAEMHQREQAWLDRAVDEKLLSPTLLHHG